VQQPDSLLRLTARVRRLRTYRLLANSYVPLLAIALALLVFRWIFPWVFSVVAYIWAADAFLLVLLAVPWLLVSSALAFGKIKCPACDARFASGFHLWVPKGCQSCGYDITIPTTTAASDNRRKGP
jgi:hypothetical protein